MLSFYWRKNNFQGSSGPNYFNAVNNVVVVGKDVANFMSLSGIKSEKSHCIGHSLGAHVCGKY